MEKKKVRKKKDRSKIVTLCEKHIIKKGHMYYDRCDELSFLAKNLYNATLYEQRQSFFQNNFKSHSAISKEFAKADQVDYRVFPAKVAREIQRLSDQAFKSFFALKKLQDKGKYDKPIKIPKYLDKKKGRMTVPYEKGAVSTVKKSYVSLSQSGITIPTKIDREKIVGARIVPKRDYYVIEILYDEVKVQEKEEYNRVAFIDPGMNNLMTVTSNVFNPIIYNGRQIKSINQLANKNIAKRQQRMAEMNLKVKKTLGEREVQRLNVDRSKGMKAIWTKRELRIKDNFHKITRHLVDYLVENNIDTVIVGYNKGQKQEINLGKKTNQNFVYIPFATLRHMLKYKCTLAGIKYIEQEEAYTSKCSFVDREAIKKKEKYQGERIERGLYKTSTGKEINADVNGSLNIGRKYLEKQKLYSDKIHNELLLHMNNPKRITITQ